MGKIDEVSQDLSFTAAAAVDDDDETTSALKQINLC